MEGFLNRHEVDLVETRFTEKRSANNSQAINDKFTGERSQGAILHSRESWVYQP